MASINYYLHENKLKDGAAPSYAARVVSNQIITQNDLIQRMANSNTTVSRQDIIVVMDLLKEAISTELLLGNRITTDLFMASLSIRGAFDGKGEEFDRNIHTLRVNLHANAALRNTVRQNATVSRTPQKYAVPDMVELFDAASERLNSTVTPGGAAELRGSRLTVDTDDKTQGLFLKQESGETTIRVERYHIATGSRIFFTVPADLPAGNLSLVLRSLRGTKLQEESLNAVLTAA